MRRIQFGDIDFAAMHFFEVQTFGGRFVGIDLVYDGPQGMKRVAVNISAREARCIRRALKQAIHRIEEKA
ncbi:hypothetical protein [Kitasatospora sp. MBT66]|uniref:hypothetical protein n=1 Tax=Kitasatospora sp. MBT66 TaxID=1444769 RepID=UPI0005B9AAA2|nr:hypothetical protein [Kitasatospora sp. MBT66]